MSSTGDDENNLIVEDNQIGVSTARKIFIFMQVLPTILELSTYFQINKPITYVLKEFPKMLAIIIILISIYASKNFFGPELIGVKWHFNCSQSGLFSFEFNDRLTMTTNENSTLFWSLSSFPILFWLFDALFWIATDEIYGLYYTFVALILSCSNVLIYLKANSKLNEIAEQELRSVLINEGGVEEFRELNDQQTLENISKEEEDKNQ